MKTNLRIDKVLEFIPEGSKVADIGCDHGYVLIKGVMEKKIKYGIGVDVSKGPLQQAITNLKEYGLEEKIEIRLGDGLKPINESEGDICVIGGMGGRLITNILKEDIDKSKSFRRLILQPMNSESILRKFLLSNGWTIIDEEILILDRLYLYIVAEKGSMKVEDDFIYDIGPIMAAKRVNGKDKYIEEKIVKLQKILINIKKSKTFDKNKTRSTEERIEKWRSYLEN
jgi:tRNA (adenine22-N1)-methyltransferase